MKRSRPPFRADHVGSFLRPAALKDARAKHASGEISAAALAAIENREIEALVRKQEEAGLRSITDGEFRRAFWNYDFLGALDGVEAYLGERKISFQGRQPRPMMLRVIGRLGTFSGHPMIEHFRFVKSHTRQTPKMTIPSPSSLHFRYGRSAVPESIYPDMDEFYADLGKTYRQAVRAFADAGCTYIQLDEVNFTYLCDPKLRQTVADRGDDPNQLPHIYASVINAAISDAPAGMATAMHLCRGNFQSTFVASGGYEPVAEILFNEVKIQNYFMEYDSDRAGGFEPLRFVPKGKNVVLGLVTSKSGALETKDELRRRIDEAAKYIALSSACRRNADSPPRRRATCWPRTSNGPSCAASSKWPKRSGAGDAAGDAVRSHPPRARRACRRQPASVGKVPQGPLAGRVGRHSRAVGPRAGTAGMAGIVEGKVAIVTGAGRGIGRAIALMLAQEGAKVVVNDVGAALDGSGGDAGPAQQVVEEIEAAGGKAVANTMSIGEPQTADGIVRQAVDKFGRVDILVNNAGILRDRIFHRMSWSDWSDVISVHLHGSFSMSRAVAGLFREQGSGSMIHMTSTSGLIGNFGQANYMAAKMGIVGLSRGIALDMQKFNVRSNAIAPFAWGRMIGSIPTETEAEKERVARLQQMTPEKIAPLVVYLGSDGAEGISGQIFSVRNNEIFLFNQTRPIRSIHRSDGWTPAKVGAQLKGAFGPSFTPLDRSGDVFAWDPI